MSSIRALLRIGSVSVLLAATLFVAASATAQVKPSLVKGDILVTVPAGTAQATINTIASSLAATVTGSWSAIDFEHTTDLYRLHLNAVADQPQTLNAVAKAKTLPGVKNAFPNSYKYPLQATSGSIPNDPRWSLQWDMTQINMPLAWTLEKGQSNVVIAVVDTGTDIDHPDFDKSRIYKPFNAITKSTDPRPKAGEDHGTMTAGFAAGWTNNSTGQASVTWQNVKLMPINAGDSNGFTDADLVTAYQYVIDQAKAATNLKFVMNLSLGGRADTDTPDPATLAPSDLTCLNAAKSGVLVVASAGNSFDQGNPPTLPASLAAINNNVVCVAATASNGLRTYYSESRPYTTVAAPGGDFQQTGVALAVMVPVAMGTYGLWPDNGQFAGFDGGTSAAAPHVTGVAALLLSVPGVNVSDVKAILQSTAKRVGGAPVPGPDYGYGIVDAYAALLKVAIAVTIITPEGTGGKSSGTSIPQPVETLRPEVRIQVAQVFPQNLTITVDGGTAIPYVPSGATPPVTGPYFTIENVTATLPDPNNAGQTLPSVYQVVLHNVDFSPGNHTIVVTGTKDNGSSGVITVSDTRTFTVQPHVIPAGRSMISFPYYEFIDLSGQVTTDPHDPSTTNHITPQIYLGTNFRLARWLPDQERYVFYSSFGQSENAASFTPADVLPRQDGDPATPAFAKWPVGLGFWADVESNKPILTKGQPLTDRAFIIPLKSDPNAGANVVSWNMIGDPFPFDVPFNSLLVDTPLGRISIQEAANRGYILPNIYSYDGATGYTFQTLPAGALRAWTGHWVGLTSNVDLNLVVPPAKVSRAPAAPSRTAVGSGWMVQLGAHTRSLHDSYNFIGAGTRAQDGYDATDAPKPPMAGPFVSLGISHTDWKQRAGMYAQDIRSAGPGKAWNVVVNTDQPNSDVTVAWNTATLPKTVRLTLKDDSTGQTYDMRTRSSLTFNSGSNPAPRSFTVSSAQSTGRGIRIANLNVRPAGRATGTSLIGFTLAGDATYEVRVLNASGGTVTTVGSRAAAATGDVSVLWNGRDNAGKPVAAGTYIVQVKATTADGEAVKAIQPFTVVR